MHTERLFLGTSGVHPDGSSWDTSVVEVPIKQAMIRPADEVVLLAGADKFPGTGSGPGLWARAASTCWSAAAGTDADDAGRLRRGRLPGDHHVSEETACA